MLIVLAKAQMGEGAVVAARDAIKTMVDATMEEEGCIAYSFTTDICDPSVMYIIEKWVDDAALAAHFATPHMAAFQGALANLEVTIEEAIKYQADGGMALM